MIDPIWQLSSLFGVTYNLITYSGRSQLTYPEYMYFITVAKLWPLKGPND